MKPWTDNTIERFPLPKSGQKDVRTPQPGLVLRLTAHRKSWVIRKDGTKRTKGTWPEISWEAAKELVSNGSKPTGILTVEEACTLFLETSSRTSIHQCDPVIQNRILPYFGADTRLDELDRTDYHRWIVAMKKEGLTTGVNRYWQLFSQVIRHAVSLGAHDVDNTTLVRTGVSEQAKVDVYSEDDLRAVWGLVTHATAPGWCARLTLALLLRQDTIRQLRFSWISADGGTIEIPPEAMKVKRPVTHPLTPWVHQLLTQAQSDLGGEDLIIPGRGGEVPLARCSTAQALRRHVGPDLACHKSRRTAGSWMAGQGIALEVISQTLQHAPKGVTAQVYIREAARLPQVREALEAWGERLRKIVEG